MKVIFLHIWILIFVFYNIMETYQKLIKENRYWEVIVTKINNTLIVKTRYGLNGGKTTETKPQTFQKSKGLTFIKKKITDKIRTGYKPESGKEIKNKQVKSFIKPMSAILLEGNENKIVFPAYVQPKLDGFRGITFRGTNKSSGKVSIVSRNGLPYPHLEKIKKELESFPLIKQGYSLDGELYIHGVSIGELRSVLGRKELNNQKVINIEKNIKYYIFDFFKNNEEIPFEKRLLKLQEAFNNWNSKLVQLTDTKIVKSLEDVKTSRNKFIENGYEGIIVRNKNGIYLPGKKSIDVFRSKEFKTDLFMIIGANEGKGNNKGTVIWELQCLNTKKTFTAKPIGTKEERTQLYNNRNKYIGLKIPIKYYELDKTTGCVTRHPVALEV